MKVKNIMRKKFLKISHDSTLSELLGLMKKNKEGNALVFKNNKLLGIVNKFDIIKSKVDIKNRKVKTIVKPVPELKKDFDLIDAATLLFHSNTSILPVENGGIVKASDVISKANISKKVKDITYNKVINVNEKDRIGKVIEIFDENKITQVPVVNKDGFLGIVSSVDIFDKFVSAYLREVSDKKNTVGVDKPDMMALPVISFVKPTDIIVKATLNEDVKSVAKKMEKNRVSNAIILKGRSPEYIVTKRDILEAIMNLKKEMDYNIFFKGFNKLTENYQKHYAEKLCSYYAEKIKYLLQNDTKISVHLKEYKTAGKKNKQHKYSVHLKVDYPGKIFVSTKSSDWDLPRTIHKAFNDVENQIKSKWKKDERNLKAREPSKAKKIQYLSQKFLKWK